LAVRYLKEFYLHIIHSCSKKFSAGQARRASIHSTAFSHLRQINQPSGTLFLFPKEAT
jgi:hypothetical protein